VARGVHNTASEMPTPLLRARLVRLSRRGLGLGEIARLTGVDRRTVRRWLDRFARHGFAGLGDRHRRGSPRRLTDAQVGEVRRLLSSTTLSSRAIAARAGTSQSSVIRFARNGRTAASSRRNF